MKANKMREVARLYGVALQQYFTIDGYNGKFYFDCYEGLCREGDGLHFEITLASILRGDLEIKPVGYDSGKNGKGGSDKVNYYERVASMFGLKLGERFVVEESGEHVSGLPNEVFGSTFVFTSQGILRDSPCVFWDGVILSPLLKGTLTIRKIWKPTFGETVYVPIIGDGEPMVKKCYYENTDRGKQLLKDGLICKNKQEAEEKAQAMLRAMKEALKKYDEERNIHRVA